MERQGDTDEAERIRQGRLRFFATRAAASNDHPVAVGDATENKSLTAPISTATTSAGEQGNATAHQEAVPSISLVVPISEAEPPPNTTQANPELYMTSEVMTMSINAMVPLVVGCAFATIQSLHSLLPGQNIQSLFPGLNASPLEAPSHTVGERTEPANTTVQLPAQVEVHQQPPRKPSPVVISDDEEPLTSDMWNRDVASTSGYAAASPADTSQPGPSGLRRSTIDQTKRSFLDSSEDEMDFHSELERMMQLSREPAKKKRGRPAGSKTKKKDAPSLEDKNCKVCRERLPTHLITTCGHCFCLECILELRNMAAVPKCPVCRKIVGPHIKMFL